MACFIVPMSTPYQRQFPVIRRQLCSYRTPGWQELALANAILEEIIRHDGSCDDCHCGTPSLASRKTPVKRTETKKTDTSVAEKEQETVGSEPGNEATSLEQSHIEPKAKNFRLAVGVGNVSPDDLKVKLSDGVLTVSGKSTESDTDGNVYSVYTFTREFTLPENVDVESLTSKLTEDGVLTFEAPLMALKEPTEKYLPITVDKSEDSKEPTANELNEESKSETEEFKSETELPQLEESVKCEGEKENVVDA